MQQIFFAAFPRSHFLQPQCNPASELCRQFLRPHGLVLGLSAVRPYIDRYVTFQIMFNPLNLKQVDSTEGVETSQR